MFFDICKFCVVYDFRIFKKKKIELLNLIFFIDQNLKNYKMMFSIMYVLKYQIDIFFVFIEFKGFILFDIVVNYMNYSVIK